MTLHQEILPLIQICLGEGAFDQKTIDTILEKKHLLLVERDSQNNLSHVRIALIANGPGDVYSQACLAHILRYPCGQFLLAATDPGHQRKGSATRTGAEALLWFKEKGVQEVWTSCWEGHTGSQSLGYLTQLGFTIEAKYPGFWRTLCSNTPDYCPSQKAWAGPCQCTSLVMRKTI